MHFYYKFISIIWHAMLGQSIIPK